MFHPIACVLWLSKQIPVVFWFFNCKGPYAHKDIELQSGTECIFNGQLLHAINNSFIFSFFSSVQCSEENIVASKLYIIIKNYI